MTREQVLEEAYNRGFEKAAMPRGLGDVPLGAGPDQMEQAVRLLGQARALGSPTDRELNSRQISREDFVKIINEMGRHSRLSDARADKGQNMLGGGLLGGLGGVAAGAATHGVPGAIAAGLAGAGAGTLYGKLRADNKNAKVLRVLRLLKERGVLSPKALRTVRPILT